MNRPESVSLPSPYFREEHDALRAQIRRFVENGGLLFSDDCNHDVNGLYAKSFESEMQRAFGAGALKKLPNDHPIYRTFFKFTGPPQTRQDWPARRYT